MKVEQPNTIYMHIYSSSVSSKYQIFQICIKFIRKRVKLMHFQNVQSAKQTYKNRIDINLNFEYYYRLFCIHISQSLQL